ncbi:hypothetical protein [Paraclostridium bifermentans]
MDFQLIAVPMFLIYIAVIVGFLGTAFYALLLLIKALKIYIKNNS